AVACLALLLHNCDASWALYYTISQDEFNQIWDKLREQEGEIRGLKDRGARLPALALPTKFSGEASKVHVFRRQCMAYLEARHTEFPQEDVKVAWIYSLLDGPAATWATALYDAGSTYLNTAQQFLAHLRNTWGIEDDQEAADYQELPQHSSILSTIFSRTIVS
uniref:DUF4939 domain-containing protein n=1 Tax=Anolis carolinensis TaxID=28377 RepID=A0A803TNU9_ANOCA